ncbi:MAG: sigma 54-interacting transcriptional regulator, partial [Acidobacteriota bacterium]
MSEHHDETVDRTWSRTAGSTVAGPAVGRRVPGLTILYHPDLDRLGERTVLATLGASGEASVSRRSPLFAAPGGERSRPLDDNGLSRTPWICRRRGDRLVIERAGSKTRLVIDGQPVPESIELSVDRLDDGIVLLLGGRVVLLLHLLDPIADLTTPRFGLIGEHPSLAQVRRDIVQVADLDVAILVRGESGTGKELVARAIHEAGPRCDRPYLALNMAALPSTLAASELFGAERGAYTGADRRRTGYFERADGGTLFLDEVGETPTDVQALLLRALETGEIQRVGAEETKTVAARVISATDADLEREIRDGAFRAPLLHRLSGYVVRLPPLRRRREDFGRLFGHFLRRELDALGLSHRLAPRRHPWLPAATVARWASWHWPGNVRQLANVVRQVVIANRRLDPAERFDEVDALLASGPPPKASAPEPIPTVSTAGPRPSGPRKPSDLREDEVIAALRSHRFRPAAAADA